MFKRDVNDIMDQEVTLPDRVVVVPYDPAWRSQFATEAELILRALGDNVVAVHHIGSTAIPGIFAKPIIDILLEVHDLARLDSQAGALMELGYEAMGEFGIPGRRYFRKINDAGVRTHHVHAFQAGSAEVERHLAFRDYMIAHPAAAEAYGALKRELAQAHPDDRQAYMDGKDTFVKEHEAKALDWWRSRRSA
jgi:GrpB-like predicted nucleotidyltransferase (UPF0157 family)